MEILLRCVPMLCLQIREFSKIIQNREVSAFFQRLDFAPNSIKYFICQPKLRPAMEGCLEAWRARRNSLRASPNSHGGTLQAEANKLDHATTLTV